MKKTIYIIGISAFYHDSAVSLLKNGEIIAAAQEERFSRKKHDSAFPRNALKSCLDYAGISLNDIEFIAFYDKPLLKFKRLLETYYTFAPKGLKSFLTAIPVWINEKIKIKQTVLDELENIGCGKFNKKLLFPEHHLSHAASAFFPSPYEDAAILTVDGVGEFSTTTLGYGNKNKLKIIKEIHFPNSLGLLYSSFTYHTGFKVNSGEYKLMGLAPFGESKYVDKIYDKLIKVKEDGSFILNMKYFNYSTGLTMTNSNFNKLFGHKPRKPESKITQHEMDMAASIQKVTEEVMLKLVNYAYNETGSKNLVMAGGVALNCVANGNILRKGPFKNIWIQPAAGDAGGALGSAYSIWHLYLNNERSYDGKNDRMKGSYLGPSYTDDDVKGRLKKFRAIGENYENEDELLTKAAHLIKEGSILGWHQGRMEFGPRALGSRSILGDATNSEMQKKMNLKIKYRESFRPFAPSVMIEMVNDYFDLNRESPYMLLVDNIKKDRQVALTDEQKKILGIEKLNIQRSDIPAVTHVDYSARIHTVDKKVAYRYWKLLNKLKKMYNIGIIVNTSFNVRGEPIVCTPEDAYLCFMRTEMNYLIIGNWLFNKQDQPELKENVDWRNIYELD